MSLTSFAIRNYRFVIVFTAAALVLGVLGFLRLPRQEDPTLPGFGGRITVIYPAATADEIEDRVIEPLENAINELEEIESIEATAADGVAFIIAEFREDEDAERAYDLLVQRVSTTRGELPDGVVDLRMAIIKPSQVVVLQAAIHGETATDAELKFWAEELESRWRILSDVKAVEVEGAQAQEVHVVVDPDRVAASGLSLGAVADAIAAANGDLPAGVVHVGPRRLNLRPNPRFVDLDDIRNTVLTAVDGRPVRLGHLATVSWGSEDPSYLVRHEGQRAAMVTATLKEGRNVLAMTPPARTAFEDLKTDLPAHLSASLVIDQSRDVESRLRLFGISFLQGGVIIALFVALMVGWRAAVVAITAMFLAVGISFWLMATFHISLQQMSIAGLVVVLGLLVDNAIVVVESILHERQRGLDPVAAAIRGTDRVGAAVASSTATTVAAFAPMLLMEGSVGDFTRDIPATVSLVLIVSLLVALFVTPLVATRLFAGKGAVRPRGISPWLNRVASQGAYARTLDFVQARPRTAVAVLVLGALLLLALTPLVGMNFFPRADDKPQYLVRVLTPQGTSLQATYDRAVEVEGYLREQELVRSVTTNVGRGNPLLYYNLTRDFEQPTLAEILVTVDRKNSRHIPALARQVREQFGNRPDFDLQTKDFVQGPPVGRPVSIRLKGQELDRLSAHADELEAALRELPGAINVSHDLRPGPARLELSVDPVKVSKLGLNSAVIAREIRFAMAGGAATTLRRADEDLAVVVRVAREGDEQLSDLERIRIPVPGGEPVPLSQLTRPSLSSTYARIMHTDLERSVIVGADLDGRLATEIVAELLPAVESLELASNESWEVIGEDEERDRAFMSMLNNVVTALGLIYGILVLQFRSFKLPLIIFTSIPVAMAGSVIGLMVGGWPFGFTAFIGLLALTGIVVNDAIVLVDRVNQYRRDGEDLYAAVRHGAASRLQPILLTTITTQAGLLPLTLFGGSMWGPLGWVVIGGLAASTLVTLVLVPALYLLAERAGEKKAASATKLAHEGSPSFATASLLILALIAIPTSVQAQDAATTEILELSDVLARVTEASPQLAAARDEQSMAEADAHEARSMRLPVLQLEGSWSVTDDPSQTFGIQLSGITDPMELFDYFPGGAVDLLEGAVGAEWVLYDRSRGARVRAADAAHDARGAGTQATARALRRTAAVLYFQSIQLAEQIRVQQASLVLVDRELKDAELRRDAGRSVLADVLGLRARRAQIDATRVRLTGALTVIRSRLAELMVVPSESLGLADASTQLPPGDFASQADHAAVALIERSELAAARAELEAMQQAISAASGERWPRLVARARYASRIPEGDADREFNFGAASLALEWRPWRGGGIGAAVDRARAELRRAEHGVAALVEEVRRESVEAWTRRATARLELEAAELQLEAAQEAYRIVSLRFAEGRDTLARLLEAERALTGAQTARVRQRALLQITEIQLRWVAGRPLLNGDGLS